MKITIAISLAIVALATFTGCETTEPTTTTQTTTEETTSHAAPATTSTQVIRSY